MKFTKEHYDILANGIAEVLLTNSKTYLKKVYSELTKRRFRWDLYWASGIRIGDGVGTSGDIIGDYDDDHLDTALRAVVKEFNLEAIGI